MVQRRKLHDELVDEDYCPKRKIIKLEAPPTSSDKIFNNCDIVDTIIRHIIDGNSIIDNLHLRLINKAFDRMAKSAARVEYRQIIVSPYTPKIDESGVPEEQEFDDDYSDVYKDRSFVLNDRRVKFSRALDLSHFLRSLGTIHIRDVTFAGYTQYDERVHDFILHEVLNEAWLHLHTFKGSEEVCPGCSVCNAISSRAKIYGPIQFMALQNLNQEHKHFEQLIVTEILLAQIACWCVETVESKAEALARLQSLISPKITCDQLDLVFSDRCMWSEVAVTHPREVIDCMLASWKCTTVNVRFITEYSSVDNLEWASKGIFTECRFDEKYVAKSTRRDRLALVEVDMQVGDEIATCFAESMGMKELNGMSMMAFQNACVNCRRLFPTQDMFILLPHELAPVASAAFDNFCNALLEFAWKDQLTARHLKLYFRLFTFGIAKEDVIKQVDETFFVNRRSIDVEESKEAVRTTFQKWLPGTTTTFERWPLSFHDVVNKSSVHLEVCVEPT